VKYVSVCKNQKLASRTVIASQDERKGKKEIKEKNSCGRREKENRKKKKKTRVEEMALKKGKGTFSAWSIQKKGSRSGVKSASKVRTTAPAKTKSKEGEKRDKGEGCHRPRSHNIAEE